MPSPPAPTLYRDRATGRLEEERVFGREALSFLYGSRLGRIVEGWVSRGMPNRIYGLVQRSPGSRRKIPDFVLRLGIDTTECSRPLEDYRSLDDFFSRALRPGARPIDGDPTHLVSPCDGRALAFPDGPDGSFRIKGQDVSKSALLGDRALASRYAGGSSLVIRLAPADYHRFHFPDEGNALQPRSLPGSLHSVHPIALASGARSFENRRMVALFSSRAFGDLALIEVGALCVGTIIQTYRPGYAERGSEKGLFRFGGSTVVLLAEPGRLRLDEDLLEATRGGVETLVRMGTRVGCAP